MAQWGKVKPLTKEVGGKTYTFKSLLEMRWAVWCQLRKEQGIILDWAYESVEAHVAYKSGEIKIYRPDFTIIQCCEGEEHTFAYEETKGWFQAKDYTKMKLFAEQYENPLTLIFANLTNCKGGRTQYGRAKRLEKLLRI